MILACAQSGAMETQSVRALVAARTESLPLRSKRVEVLEKAGLKREIAPMDELDKDMLFLRARHQSLARLQQMYPQIPAHKLLALQKLTRGAK